MSSTSITLSWQTPYHNGAVLTGYTFKACDVDSQTCSESWAAGPEDTEKVIDSLTSGRNYTVAVEASSTEKPTWKSMAASSPPSVWITR